MDAQAQLKLAGEAAEILETMGFVAVARLKSGVVSLEFWRGERAMRYELPDVAVTPRSLAEACASEYSARVGDES